MALLLLASRAPAQPPLGDLRGLATLADLGRLQDWRVAQSSSYDLLSEQGDPLAAPPRDDQGRYVLCEADGPGCVTRLWGSGLSGNLMIWLDDDAEGSAGASPSLQGPWEQWAYSWWTYRHLVYENKPEPPHVSPFLCPLGDDSRTVQMLILPLAFERRCKIAMDQAPAGNHYCVDTVRAVRREGVSDFQPQNLSPEAPPLKEILEVWRDPGNRFLIDPQWEHREGLASLQSGEALTLLEAGGSGQVRLLLVEFNRAMPLAGRALVLRGYWDGEGTPRLEVPLGDLCGIGLGNGHPNVPAGVEGANANSRRPDLYRFYCRLPMPFGQGARLTLTNESPWPLLGFTWKVWWENRPDGMPGYGRFGGFMQRLPPANDADSVRLLTLTGKGHLVGYNMALWEANQQSAPLRWFAEARLDGEEKPRLQGAPFFDFNWGPRGYWHPGPVAGVCGTTHHEWPQAPYGRDRIAFYRYLLQDAVRFDRSCEVILRRGAESGLLGPTDVTWLFYLEPGAQRSWPALDRTCLPWPETRGTGIEAEELAATSDLTRGTLSVVPDRWGAYQFSNGAMLVYAAEQPGDVLELPVPAEEDGYYHLLLRQIGGPTFCTYRLRREGRELQEPLYTHGEDPGAVVAEDPKERGVWYLKKGNNPFEFVCTPESGQTETLFGLDCLWLRPVSQRTNLTEAEYLDVVEAENCTVRPEPLGHPLLGGWGELRLQPTGQEAAVTLRVPVAADRQPALLLMGYRAEPGTTWELRWDDQSLGQVRAEVPATPFYRSVAAFHLPEISAGEHQANIRLHSDHPVWLDFFKVGSPTVMEAEALPFYSAGYLPQLEAAAPRADEPQASENVAVLHRNTGPERPLLVGLPVTSAGEYRLTLWMNTRGNGGHFEFEVNGQPAGQPVALPPAPPETLPVDLGVVSLATGLNTVTIRSDQWFLLDAVEVKP